MTDFMIDLLIIANFDDWRFTDFLYWLIDWLADLGEIPWSPSWLNGETYAAQPDAHKQTENGD